MVLWQNRRSTPLPPEVFVGFNGHIQSSQPGIKQSMLADQWCARIWRAIQLLALNPQTPGGGSPSQHELRCQLWQADLTHGDLVVWHSPQGGPCV